MHSAYIGEFLGTMVLILLGDGVVANVVLNRTKGQSSGWIVIATGWALAVLIGVFVANATGSAYAHLNPAVSIAHGMLGIASWDIVPGLIVAQFAGAFVGAVLVYLQYLPHWSATEDQGAKLAVFSTGPAIRNTGANLISEIIGTALLVFGIAAIFSVGVKGGPTGPAIPTALGPYMVGMLIWAIGLSLGGSTGYAINPARDLGPRIAHAILPISGKGGSDWGYSWIPVVGPVVGAIAAAMLVKAFVM